MAKIYISAASFLKERLFELWTPALYQPNISRESVSHKSVLHPSTFKQVPLNHRCPTPYFQHDDPFTMQRTSYSIERMIDMHNRKFSFDFLIEEDVVEVFDGLDRYLLTLESDIKHGNDEAISYARLVLAFREEMYKLYYRYMMLNPAALEKLYPNSNRNDSLTNVLERLGGSATTMITDPLQARRKPPFDIDKILPKEHQKSADHTFESSLGLTSARDFLQDDGKGFALDDFMKR